MPSYDYMCRDCGHGFSDIQRMDDRNVPCESPCKECGGEVFLKVGAPILGYNIKPPGMRTSENFNDRLKELKRGKGKDNTIGDAIR